MNLDSPQDLVPLRGELGGGTTSRHDQLLEDAHTTWSHEEPNDDEDDPREARSPEDRQDACNHKHDSDDPQDGGQVAGPRRERPEISEHVSSLRL